MSGPFFYSLVRRWPEGGAIEAAPADRADVRATLWPGPQPPPHPDHPSLASCEATGVIGRQPTWVESRPRGAPLSELAASLTRAELARVLLDVREALLWLHAVGLAHGSVRASRVVIGTDGVPVLIGVGQDPGSLQGDLDEFARLVAACGFDGIADLATDAGAPVRRSAVEPSVREPDPDETIELTEGGVDEVKVDLGPDESAAGLLERWSTVDATSGGEPTRAPGERGEALAVVAPRTAPDLPEVTISAPRAAIPPERTSPRVERSTPEPTPIGDVTVTEILAPGATAWTLVLAMLAIVAAAIALWLAR